MKKTVLMAVLVLSLFSVGAFAQAQTGYFSILPGYQFSSSGVESGWVIGFDGGYYFNDWFGLHGGLQFNEGNFKMNAPGYTFKFDDAFYLLEAGPEFVGKAGEKGQIYGQINLGYAFGLQSSVSSVNLYGNTYTVETGSAFAYGAAFGYRYFFTDKVALNLQATYHRITGDLDTNHLDTRVGVAFKF